MAKEEVKQAVKEVVEKKFELPNVKVHLKPILRDGSWLPIGHSGNFMYDHTGIGVMTPIDKLTGKLHNPLTREEQVFFETESGLDFKEGDLNPYKKKDNFWNDFKVTIRKSDSIVTDKTILMTLNLANPIEYLQYKILLANSQPDGGLIAPNWEQREWSGTYRIALVHEGEQHVDKIKKADMMKKAYKYLSKIDSSGEAMFDFLTIFYLDTNKGKQPSKESDKDYYYAEIQSLIESNLQDVVGLIDDAANYEYKLLVHRGLKIGALKLIGGNKIETIDGTPVGNNLSQAISWFKDDKHQDEYLRIKNQIELAK
jgi:hypothetical protein